MLNRYIHSDFSFDDMIVNISGGHTDGDTIQFDNAWIR